jgi:hypothetical protein
VFVEAFVGALVVALVDEPVDTTPAVATAALDCVDNEAPRSTRPCDEPAPNWA